MMVFLSSSDKASLEDTKHRLYLSIETGSEGKITSKYLHVIEVYVMIMRAQ